MNTKKLLSRGYHIIVFDCPNSVHLIKNSVVVGSGFDTKVNTCYSNFVFPIKEKPGRFHSDTLYVMNKIISSSQSYRIDADIDIVMFKNKCIQKYYVCGDNNKSRYFRKSFWMDYINDPELTRYLLGYLRNTDGFS